jgi:hypothetical protein
VSKPKQSLDSSVQLNPEADASTRSSPALPSSENSAGPLDMPLAKRNLVLGIVLNLIAIPMCGAAFVFAPREAFVSLAAALLIALVVFVSIQFGVMFQRNGAFALIGLGLVLTLLVPLGVSFCASGAEWVRLLLDVKRSREIRIAAERESGAAGTALHRESSLAGNHPLPSETSGIPAHTSGISGPAASLAPASHFADSKASGQAESSEVKNSGGKAEKGAKVNDPQLEDPIRPEESSAERTTRLSKDEALKRYPALATPGTPEHSRYLDAYNEFARLRKFEFFKDPKWPLNLAELVALKEGWTRADQLQGESPNRASEPQKARGTQNLQAASASTAPKAGAASPANSVPQAPDRAEGDGLPGDGLSLDIPAVDASDPNAKAVNQAMIEVRRRYPAIGQNGTPENRAYVAAYRELERLRPDFFENPQWPVKLADLVAKSEGWKR